MDQAVATTIAGLGGAAVVARSTIGYWAIRKPANFCGETLARTLGRRLTTNEEWCLYCTGFWVGIAFSFVGYGWLENVFLDGLYLTGITWVASEATNFAEAVWFGFLNFGENHGEKETTAELQTEASPVAQPEHD